MLRCDLHIIDQSDDASQEGSSLKYGSYPHI